jgi:hypothetical protein
MLPLCPLRQDLVAFKQMQKEHKLSSQLGGQLDGAALSYISRATPIEVTSGDDESVDTGSDPDEEVLSEMKQESTSSIDPSSRALTGPYSDSSDPESDHDGKEVAVKGTTEPEPDNQEFHDTSIIPSLINPSNDMDYFDVSDCAPLPPYSDTEEPPLSSFSHAGTIGKRKRLTSPNEMNGDTKHTKREPTSDNHSFIPTGPRALGGSPLICYYWYHKGECVPKRNHGKCRYAHTLDVFNPQVSMPPGIIHHNPKCRLPLCPHQMAQNTNHTRNNSMRDLKEKHVKDEPFTSPRRGAFPVNAGYSSSPRDSVMEARNLIKGRKSRRNRKYQQLPKLTEANRQRFKSQKQSIEKWQTDNGIKPFDIEKQREEKMELKEIKKELKKQKRQEKRRLEDTPLLKYEDDASREWDPAAIVFPARQRSKRNEGVKLRRRANDLFEADIANGGRIETFDPEAELYKQSFQPIAGFPEHTSIRDKREEMEDRQYRTENALGMIESLRHHQKPSSRRPLRAASPTRDKAEVHTRTMDAEESGEVVHATANSITGAVAPLPMEEERLEWDTDLVRQLFG